MTLFSVQNLRALLAEASLVASEPDHGDIVDEVEKLIVGAVGNYPRREASVALVRAGWVETVTRCLLDVVLDDEEPGSLL